MEDLNLVSLKFVISKYKEDCDHLPAFLLRTKPRLRFFTIQTTFSLA